MDSPPPLPDSLSWSFNPWQQNWRRPTAALATCIALAGLTAWSFGTTDGHTPGWFALSLALLLGMTALIYLPVRYRLDRDGVRVWFLGVPSQRPWAHYRNAYFHKNLVHLTTLPRPGPLDPFRGHPLQFDPASPQGNREIVRGYIEAALAPYKTVSEPAASLEHKQ